MSIKVPLRIISSNMNKIVLELFIYSVFLLQATLVLLNLLNIFIIELRYVQ